MTFLSDISEMDGCGDGVEIVMVCPNLGDGGTQKTVAALANEWGRQGRRVCVVTVHDDDEVYALSESVLHIRLPAVPLFHPRPFLFRAHRVLVGVVFSFMGVVVAGEQKLYSFFLSQPRVVQRGLRFVRRFLHRVWKLKDSLHARVRKLFPGSLTWTAKVRIRKLHWIFENLSPSLVLSFLPSANVMTLLATRGLGCRTVVCERNDPGRQEVQPPWARLRRRYYRLADMVTANSHGVLQFLRPFVSSRRLRCVPNLLDVPKTVPELSDPRLNGGPFLLVVGRLHYQKGHDILFEAFARLADAMPEWRLSVMGRGELEETLQRQADELGISDRIVWLGQVDNPFPYYRKASFFVLPSRYEGMPNALLEAMSQGLASIVTDASPGPLEVVENGKEGFVIPAEDVDALAAAIKNLAKSPELRGSMGKAAKQRAREFETPAAIASWEEVLALPPVDRAQRIQ